MRKSVLEKITSKKRYKNKRFHKDLQEELKPKIAERNDFFWVKRHGRGEQRKTMEFKEIGDN
ncbi:hypothetical protein Leryth_025425 [Lithospermum erythrorhizon]|nr:hypothetical protein Leryth_025425 [Lithospermum erythrorhizon]